MSTNLSDYNILSTYSILSYSGITVGSMTITNGYYGSYPAATYVGIYTGVGFPSGVDSANAQDGQIELNNLVDNINIYKTTIVSEATLAAYTGTSKTFYPDINYNTGATLTFTGASIIFDAQNVENAIFYITCGSTLTFTSVASMTVINTVSDKYTIYWIVGSTITINGTTGTLYGNLIAGTTVVIDNIVHVGHIYSRSAYITINGTSSIDATINDIPVAEICFLGNTLVSLDQGDFFIKDINPLIHTINNKKIIGITKTSSKAKNLICFEKNSISHNCPSEKIIMCKYHKVSYKGKIMNACAFIKKFKNVYSVKYNKEVMYNIIMESYMFIMISNMLCESLHPLNKHAILYKKKNASIDSYNP
jgi:hypothetical protein